MPLLMPSGCLLRDGPPRRAIGRESAAEQSWIGRRASRCRLPSPAPRAASVVFAVHPAGCHLFLKSRSHAPSPQVIPQRNAAARHPCGVGQAPGAERSVSLPGALALDRWRQHHRGARHGERRGGLVQHHGAGRGYLRGRHVSRECRAAQPAKHAGTRPRRIRHGDPAAGTGPHLQ